MGYLSCLNSLLQLLDDQRAEKIGLPAFMYDKAEEISRIRKDNLHKAIDLGVKVVMGTDAGTPYNYHGKNCMEIVQYVRQGLMSEMEAIVASTGRSAEAIIRRTLRMGEKERIFSM